MAAERRLALLAHCVAMGVNAVETTHRPGRDATPADWLAAALGLDMSAYWTASAEGYFTRVTKPLILAAVREGASHEEAKRLEGLKKPAMAEAAERLLAGKGWVPDVLRTPGKAAPEETPLAAE
jgi:ParB family chromosome partitioning protein